MSDQEPPPPYKAGDAYLINPPGGSAGPGVLVLHSWWGLTNWVREFCGRVAELGFTVLAPDLLNGIQPTTVAEGEACLAGLSPDELSGLVMSSAHTLRAVALEQTKPIGVIGFSMGGSMGLWLAARLPESVGCVVTYYGGQSIDFDEARANFQGHFGTEDNMVDEEERVLTESFIGLGDNQTDFHLYPGAGHWFAEAGHNFNAEAADLAWSRTVAFLTEALLVGGVRDTT